jgi:hypothetical protein
MHNSPPENLPVKHDLAPAYVLTFIVTMLMAVLSLCGLLFSSALYPTGGLLRSFAVNDAVNLIIGVPVLAGSVWLTKRGTLIGLLLWPGALLYLLYNYVAYVFGIPFGLISFAYLALVLLSAYTIYELLRSIDGERVREKLSGRVPVRITGCILIVFGILFIFRAVGMVAETDANQTMLPISEIGVLIADLVISVLWIAGGVLLLRRKSFGYASGLGLLFAGCVLFIGLILFLLLQPVLLDASLAFVDVIVVFVMGLVFFIPFWFSVRGVMNKPAA